MDDWDDYEEQRELAIGEAWIGRLNQTELWIDRHGEEHVIETMGPRYRSKVRQWLRRNAPTILSQITLAFTINPNLPHPRPTETDPDRWMVSTPLFRTLVQMDLRSVSGGSTKRSH